MYEHDDTSSELVTCHCNFIARVKGGCSFANNYTYALTHIINYNIFDYLMLIFIKNVKYFNTFYRFIALN